MAEKEPTKVEEPKVEEPKKEEAPKVDVDGMIAELEKVGVKNPQELTNKLEASAQAGRTAQLLGIERGKVEQLESQVAELQKQPPGQTYEDPLDAPAGQPIDLEAAIAKGVSSVLDKRDKVALEAQQQNLAQWNQIQGDRDYGLVKEVWERKLKDPNFVLKIQNNMISPYNEYIETVRSYYKGIAQRSLETIKTLSGTTPSVPHVETGERTPGNIVSETPSEAVTETSKKRAELAEKTAKGYQMTEQDELDIIDSLIMDSPVVGAPPKQE